MPAIVSLPLTNRDATPVSVVFDPVNIVGDIATFRKAGSTSLADKVISVSARTTPSGYRKVAIKIAVPVVSIDTSTGVTVTSLARKAHCKMEFSFAPDATEDEMNEIVAYAYDSLKQDKVNTDFLLTKGDSLY